MLIINFKNYKVGKDALVLAKKIEKVLPSAIVCPSAFEVGSIVRGTKLKVFAQHLDSGLSRKKRTGFLFASDLKKLGGSGSLINHSEHRISSDEISRVLKEVKRVGLKMVLCVESVSEAKKFKRFKPWAIAFEDAKLIGAGKSVTEYNPSVVSKFVDVLKGTRIVPLCGAGISSYEDYSAALGLGCKGVLISSAIAKARKPELLLRKFRNS